jgi:hypothetical protein
MLSTISKLGLTLSVSGRMLNSDNGDASASCWKKAHGRTDGSEPMSCPDGSEVDFITMQCFEASEDDYFRLSGTGNYYENCPSGFI